MNSLSIGVLSACLSVHHTLAVPSEAKRGCQMPETVVIDRWINKPSPMEWQLFSCHLTSLGTLFKGLRLTSWNIRWLLLRDVVSLVFICSRMVSFFIRLSSRGVCFSKGDWDMESYSHLLYVSNPLKADECGAVEKAAAPWCFTGLLVVFFLS